MSKPHIGGLAVVRGLNARAATGTLTCGALTFPCALGRSGRTHRKCEGDGATPIGHWPIRLVLYRPDRLRRPETALPTLPIGPRDGWCDAAGDRNYNRRVTLPYPASHEALWRADGLYDICVVLGFNDGPCRQGGGSAIFIHVAAANFTPTAGCVALRRGDLLTLLRISPAGILIS